MPERDPHVREPLHLTGAFGLEIDGQSLHRGWTFERFEEPPADRPGQRHACVTLKHSVRPVSVRVHTVMDGTALLSRWLEISNTAKRPAALSGLRVWSGPVFPLQGDGNAVHGPYSIGYFQNGVWGNEGQFHWQPIGQERIEIGEDKGRSGWGHPIVFLRDEAQGHIFVAQLAWSGNWTASVEQRNGLLFLTIGPSAPGPMRVLDPGENVPTPPVHVGCLAGDISTMVQQIHDHQRRSVFPPPPKGGGICPVTYNTWGYSRHEITEEKLIGEIDVAADVGAELFIVDASWYGDEGVKWQVVPGYWRPGNRLPRGFKPVFSHARKKGLKVGVWFWIEAASEDGKLIKEHPDWLLSRDGKKLNNMLDLSKPDVAKHMESELVRAIEEYELDCFRLDYNASPGEGGYNLRHGYEENTLWRHCEAMYAIWERVRRRFPNLLMENCAGGGGRTDLGQLSRFHHTQTSDHWLMPRVVRIHNGLTLALAPETMMRMFGVCGGHVGGGLDAQLRSTFLSGVPGLGGLSPAEEDRNPILLERIRRAVKFFKEHVRPMIRTCRMFHHTPELQGINPEGCCVFEYAAPDAGKSILGVFRLAGQGETERTVRPRGLSRSETYRVTLDNGPQTYPASGRDLADQGICVRLPHAMASELILIEAIRS
jgi:alpha-galactosidase